ncbi:MAG: hypothetical protein M3R44_04395 [Candidatus Eremiobacteraeota bacterium]|nr:hypothetical protein [Candidatus Eremiobacteraeota bacterium]
MNDATEGTHADPEALEPQRRVDVYPGEPDFDDDGSRAELGDVEKALDEETQ